MQPVSCDNVVPMDNAIEITRSIELDLGPADVWELIGDGDGWADWMVDTAIIDVAPGSTGAVIDDDEQRDVRIDHVDEGERVMFEWWPSGRRDHASSVVLHIVPTRRGTMLKVVETFPAVSLSASVVSSSWHRRLTHLDARRRMLVAA